AGVAGTIGAAAVIDAAAVKENRALGHLGGNGVLFLEAQLVIKSIAPGNYPGGAVELGEVGHRPDRIALDFEAAWKPEEVECPLIAMDRLRRLPGPIAITWVR